MTNPTPEQIEAAAKAMSEATSGFFSEGSWRHLAREALAAAGVAPPGPRAELLREAREEFLPHSNDVWALDLVARLANALATPPRLDEAKLAEAIAEELNTDGWIAEEWSSGKLNATARRLVDFAVLPVLRGGGQ